MERERSNLVYASFDRVPAPKGASTHITAFARALGRAYGSLSLITIDSPENTIPRTWTEAVAPVDYGDNVSLYGFPISGPNHIARALDFRSQLADWWGDHCADIAHVRSIYEGYPLARNKGRLCKKLVFEVNGVPSIELKYHYPASANDPELSRKLYAQEQLCIDVADLLVTPAAVTARYLIARGADPSRVLVIPNGVDTDIFHYAPPSPWEERSVRMLYTGTLTSWQGIYHAVEALRLYRRDAPATLTVIGPARSKQRRKFNDYCQQQGVADYVELLEPVPQDALCDIYHAHDVAIAPLPANDRNTVQGCCPLKVIEAMAVGIPLIASDLPIITDLATNGVEALLVKPGSAKAIKDAMLELRDDPELGPRLSRAAIDRVMRDFRWQDQCDKLVAAYDELLSC